MIFTADKLKEARDSGYSDEEIWGYVSSSDDRFNSAKSEGYSLDEVATFFSSQKPVGTSFTDKLQTATEELEMTIADIPLALGEAFSGLTKTAPASFYAAKEGLARPDQYSKEALAAFDTQREYFKQLEQQAKTREAEGKSTAVGEAIRGAGQSLGFTVAGMAPAIAGGAVAGAVAGALFPPAEAATIPIGAIAGGIGSMVASAPVSYRMAGGQFLYDAFKELEESKGSPLTEEEKTKAYNELLPIAQNTALWEAGPEAIGNAVQLGALKYAFGFGKKAATNVAGQAIQKANDTLLKKVGAVAGGQAVELAGETITQTQQGADQAKMEQYVKTGSTAGAPDEYQGLAGAVKAFKEVAPTTLALGAITAGAGGAVKVVGMGGKQVGKVLTSIKKTPEQIAEDQINDAANKVANDLSISPDDTQANNLNQQIKALSEVQEIRKQTLAAIEPTSREAQTLKLDIAEGESMLGELNKQFTGLTGLSEPITEAERQQAELAKAIVEEPTPIVKESLTVQPTQAAPVESIAPAPVTEKGVTGINLQEVSESVLVAFPDMTESDGGLLPLNRFTPDEQASLRKAGIVETATTSTGQTYEGVNSEYLWQRRKQLQDERAIKVQESAAPVEPTTPAPVTEQAAPAEAPAPEAMQMAFDDANPNIVTNQEDLINTFTPQEKAEYTELEDLRYKSAAMQGPEKGYKPFKLTKKQKDRRVELEQKFRDREQRAGAASQVRFDVTASRPVKASLVENFNIALPTGYTKQGDLYVYQPTPAVSETITEPAAAPAGPAVGSRIRLGKSPQTYTIEEVIPQSANDKKFGEQYYNVKNERTGKTQAVEKNDMKPVSSRRRKMASEPEPLPENERYGQVKLNQRIQRYFGGKIPDRVYVVDDAVDKEKKYQAAYYPDLGILIVNNAYIKKNANVGDIIAHELGHYAFGDKKFKAAFDNFYNSLSPEDKAKIDKIVEESYNEETEQSQIEERKVIAFTAYTIVNPQRRSLWNAVLDALKAFANKVFGKNFQMSDPNRTALAMLATAKRRFAAGEEIVREEEAEGPRKMAARRTTIMSVEAGEEVETPEAIIARTKDLLRKQFDPAKVTEKNTTEAYRALGKLAGNRKEALAYAEELNDIGRLADKSGAASEISMGAALFVNDLFEYSIRLASEGDSKMLGIMMANINRLPTAMIGASDAGRTLAARAELKARFSMMGKAEQDAYTNYVAEFIYGPNPTKEQIQSIKDAYAAVDKTQPITEEELTDEITAVGDRTGTDLVGRINEEFTKATEKKTEQRKTEEEELDTEYKKVQKQADAEIEKLAKIQSDTPSFDPAAARQTVNDVRAIVSADLKQKPDMGRKAPWKSMLVAKLQEAGVELTAAETLADIVWRQHEINSLSRELSSINKAIEKGPISEIVKAIKNTPLEDQQKPNWRYEVMRDYLRKAGLPLAQAERIAKLMDISLQKRFTMAQEQAFTDAISKSAPWKTGDTRSRRAFQKVLQALRAGALDPARNVLSDMAALNGWTGFTSDQYKALLKNDAILSDPKSADATKAEAHKAIQDIISKAKLPIRARDVIGQFYDAQALSGIPTMTVNIFSPAGMAVKNALTQSLNGLLTARPEQITAALTTFIDSIKSWANTVAFSFKNNVTVYSNVEYLVNDEGLLRLYKRGVDQFNKGKTPRDRADGVKNMMIGMMDYVRRVLNALDYGAIASLQNQAVSKYALAAMQAKGMSSKDGAKMLNAMMEQKRNFYNDQIAIGTDKNKAAVLADEFFISSWRQALTDAKLPAQQVMDAALNDAMSAVGRNRQSLDAFREEETNTRDGGVISYPALWLLETMANAANKADNQVVKLFSRMIYGFAVVPARVFRETAWFSPYGAVRFAYDYIAKKMGKTSPYAQSLGNDLQRRQRMTETITGSIVFLGFLAAMSSSTEDEEDEKPFKIVVTGNGPLRSEDPQYYDSWTKKHKANTVSVYFGKTKFTINTMRGFEAFAWPAMMLGAVDDWHIRRKQGRTTNTPLQMQDAAIVAGNVLSASLRRGPYAFAAKPLFEAYGDRGVESLAKSLAFPAKTLVPVLGASLASNISNFLNEPVDRKTLEGALWANVPFIGPAVSPKSLNAFGEPALANEAADKIFKLGVPITFNIPTDRDSVNLHELVLKQGGGPSIPTRNQLAQRLDRQPTNKEYEMFVKEYGAKISSDMKRRYEELSNKTPEKYSKSVEKIGNRARDIAERKVREAAKKP